MNQKAKWALFTLVGTVLNLLLVVVLFLFFTTLSKWILGSNPSDEAITSSLIVVLMLSLFGSFGLYAVILRWADKKWNLEKILGRNIWGKPRNR